MPRGHRRSACLGDISRFGLGEGDTQSDCLHETICVRGEKQVSSLKLRLGERHILFMFRCCLGCLLWADWLELDIGIALTGLVNFAFSI